MSLGTGLTGLSSLPPNPRLIGLGDPQSDSVRIYAYPYAYTNRIWNPSNGIDNGQEL
jgi:hypothetical protein